MMKSWLAFLAPATPLVQTPHEPPAIVEAFVTPAAATPARLQTQSVQPLALATSPEAADLGAERAAFSPLEAGARALEAARGLCARAQVSAVLRAVATSDFTGLDLNGPHTKAGDRLSRKAVRKARLVLLRIAEAQP